MLKELRELGFTWTRIVDMLGVSRWTFHRRVAEYGLQDMRGFDGLPDQRLDRREGGHDRRLWYNWM